MKKSSSEVQLVDVSFQKVQVKNSMSANFAAVGKTRANVGNLLNSSNAGSVTDQLIITVLAEADNIPAKTAPITFSIKYWQVIDRISV